MTDGKAVSRTSTADVPGELCPQCGADAVFQAFGLAAGGVETYYKVCDECEHQWGHE